MTFTVVPESLDAYAGQVERAADDARAIGSYLHRYPPPDGSFSSGGLMKLLGSRGPRAFDLAQANLGKAGTLLESDRVGLITAATYYRRADEAAAGRLDATLPDSKVSAEPTPLQRAWAVNACSPSFGDSREPSSRLTAVADVELSLR